MYNKKENNIKKMRKSTTFVFLFHAWFRDCTEKGSDSRKNIVEINQSIGTGKTPLDGFPREWSPCKVRVKFSYFTSFSCLKCIPEARRAIGMIDCGLLIRNERWLLTSSWKDSAGLPRCPTRVNEITRKYSNCERKRIFRKFLYGEWYAFV